MKYEKIYKYIPYFKQAIDGKTFLNGNLYEENVYNFLNDFEEYLIKDYEKIIGEFCFDNEGWYDIGGLHECLYQMNIEELIAILSSIIIQDKYFKGLFLSEIQNGFIHKLLIEISNNDSSIV